MSNKWLKVLGCSLLSAMFLTGCGNNDNDQSPAPEDDTTIEDKNIDDNEVVPDTDLNNDNVPDTQDQNTDNDGDVTTDDNNPGEDMIEDKNDMNDKDDVDE
ncbi:MAG: hypothetical protein ABF649_22970 [Bacillus sp. (in: firmicutes)]